MNQGVFGTIPPPSREGKEPVLDSGTRVGM